MPNFIKKFITDHITINIYQDPQTRTPVVTVSCFGLKVSKVRYDHPKDSWEII